MAETTDIAWADMTWNPWIGCQHAELPDGSPHPGCRNCYARAGWGQGSRMNRAKWGPNGTRSRTSDANWRKPLKWNQQAASIYDKEQAAYLGGDRREKPRRPRVFCGSLCDVFETWRGLIHDPHGAFLDIEPYLPMTMDHLRCDVFKLIDQTPNLTWMLLTKRPQNVRENWEEKPQHLYRTPCDVNHRENVWLGVSVSDQRSADQLIPELLKLRDLVPVLFLSVEPLLGPVDFPPRSSDGAISFVVVGAESGPNRRPCKVEWIEDIVEQCRAAGVPCFVKQGSHHKPGQQADIPDDLWNVKEFPKGET